MESALSTTIIRIATFARVGILASIAACTLLVGWLYFAGPIALRMQGATQGGQLGEYLLLAAMIWHPTLLFMVALWFLQRTAQHYARRRHFTAPAAASLSLTGVFLLLGAGATVVSKPLLLGSRFFARVLAEQQLQFPVTAWLTFDLAVASLLVGLVGVVLMLAGKVLQRAALMHDDLQQIF